MSIRLLMLGRVALFAFVLAAPASAADLGRPPVVAPPVAFSWTGCYLGGYLGGAGADRDAVFTDLGNTRFGAFSGGAASSGGVRVEGTHMWGVPLDSSVIGGGTLGCNWQPVGSAFVLGVEGEGGYMKLKGSAFDPLISPTLTVAAFRGTPDVLGSVQAGDWYAMVTGRPQVVMVHVIVGAGNAVGGIINAARSNVPVLFSAGRNPITESGHAGSRDRPIHWAQESFDQAAMVREFVKWDYELRSVSDLETVVDRALTLAQAEPQGPVYLKIGRAHV